MMSIQDDLMTLADLQQQFFALSNLEKFKKRVHRYDYIKQQLQTCLIEKQLEGKKCVFKRLLLLIEQEKKLPEIKAAIKQVKDNELPRIFVEQFHEPIIDKLNRELQLAEENRFKERLNIDQELKYLKVMAKLTSAHYHWMMHLQMMSLIRNLQSPAEGKNNTALEKFQAPPLQDMVILTPWENVDLPQNPQQLSKEEQFVGNVEIFTLLMQKLKIKEQVRQKNLIIIRDQLNQQRITLNEIKQKTSALEDRQNKQLADLEKELTATRAGTRTWLQSNQTFEIPNGAKRREKLDSLAAVDCLVETLMKQYSGQPTEMAKILEKKTKTLITQVSELRRRITNESQLKLEKKYVKKEHLRVKYEEESRAFQKRSEKLLRKFQVALLPPAIKPTKQINKFIRPQKPKPKKVVENVDQGFLEELACFGTEVDKRWLVQNYTPSVQKIENEELSDPLQLKWVAGKITEN